MNETEYILPRDSDQEFEITVGDRVGYPIDLSIGMYNVVIIVYNRDKTVLEKYSVVATAGWQAIDTTDWANGKLSFLLLNSVTKLATAGKKYYEVRVQKTDGTLPDAKYDTISTMNYLCTIEESLTQNITLP